MTDAEEARDHVDSIAVGRPVACVIFADTSLEAVSVYASHKGDLTVVVTTEAILSSDMAEALAIHHGHLRLLFNWGAIAERPVISVDVARALGRP